MDEILNINIRQGQTLFGVIMRLILNIMNR